MSNERAKSRKLIAKNIKEWINWQRQKKAYYEIAKELNIGTSTLYTWETNGSISPDNFDRLSIFTNIPQGIWMLRKEHKPAVQRWLDNDCSIIRTIIIEDT